MITIAEPRSIFGVSAISKSSVRRFRTSDQRSQNNGRFLPIAHAVTIEILAIAPQLTFSETSD